MSAHEWDIWGADRVTYTGAWRERVAAMLQDCREQAGLTQPGLAKLVGIRDRTVRRIENAETEPSGLVIERWLLATGRVVHVVLEPKL